MQEPCLKVPIFEGVCNCSKLNADMQIKDRTNIGKRRKDILFFIYATQI
jgi:hypothetical protein